jgi:hypothetical protein
MLYYNSPIFFIFYRVLLLEFYTIFVLQREVTAKIMGSETREEEEE